MATKVLGMLILLGALLLWAQLHILRGLLASKGWRWPLWLAVLCPPAAPVLAWRAGLRGRAVCWLLIALLYFLLRILAP